MATAPRVSAGTRDEAGRGWSWAALGAAVGIWAAALPTWGVSVVLAPLGILLSIIASRRSRRDGLFWVGATLNGILAIELLAILVSLLIGDASIGFE